MQLAASGKSARLHTPPPFRLGRPHGVNENLLIDQTVALQQLAAFHYLSFLDCFGRYFDRQTLKDA